MINNARIKEIIISELDNLNQEQQKSVLDYMLCLKTDSNKGVSGTSLLNFLGSIDQNDLLVMERAITEGCEKVDAGEW